MRERGVLQGSRGGDGLPRFRRMWFLYVLHDSVRLLLHSVWTSCHHHAEEKTGLQLWVQQVNYITSAVADPEFPRGTGDQPSGGTNIWFCQIFPKLQENWKNLDPGWRRKTRPKFQYVDPLLINTFFIFYSAACFFIILYGMVVISMQRRKRHSQFESNM